MMLVDPLPAHLYIFFTSLETFLFLPVGKHQSISPVIQIAPFENPAFLYIKNT